MAVASAALDADQAACDSGIVTKSYGALNVCEAPGTRTALTLVARSPALSERRSVGGRLRLDFDVLVMAIHLMPLTIYGFRDRPHDFAATKIGASLDECSYILDFTRPLKMTRWFGVVNQWLGWPIAMLVPVVHIGEEVGAYVISVRRGQPYFVDLLRLWREHEGKARGMRSGPVDGVRRAGEFAMHFPEDS